MVFFPLLANICLWWKYIYSAIAVCRSAFISQCDEGSMALCFPWFSSPSTWLSHSWCTALFPLLHLLLPLFCLSLLCDSIPLSSSPAILFFPFFLPQEVGPPRPPLPKSYQPLETSQSFPPSIPPLPLDSNAWLRSMGPHAGIHQESYKDGEDCHSRKVPERRDSTERGKPLIPIIISPCPVSVFTSIIITDYNHNAHPSRNLTQSPFILTYSMS